MKPMLATSYDNQQPTGWLMSEKLDGIRAIWTGSELISRNGNTFHAPDWFIDQLPSGVILDGELYMGRGMLQHTAAAVKRKTPDHVAWKKIRYHVFDSPATPGGFEDRLKYCAEILTGSEVTQVILHTVCNNMAHMHHFHDDIITAGGEGIMLRAPGSAYEQKRSKNLLKHKPYDTDEATLVATETGNGRLAHMVGAFVVVWRGITFRIGCGIPDSLRINPPCINSAISFCFFGLTDGGTPRSPTFSAVRNYE